MNKQTIKDCVKLNDNLYHDVCANIYYAYVDNICIGSYSFKAQAINAIKHYLN